MSTQHETPTGNGPSKDKADLERIWRPDPAHYPAGKPHEIEESLERLPNVETAAVEVTERGMLKAVVLHEELPSKRGGREYADWTPGLRTWRNGRRATGVDGSWAWRVSTYRTIGEGEDKRALTFLKREVPGNWGYVPAEIDREKAEGTNTVYSGCKVCGEEDEWGRLEPLEEWKETMKGREYSIYHMRCEECGHHGLSARPTRMSTQEKGWGTGCVGFTQTTNLPPHSREPPRPEDRD